MSKQKWRDIRLIAKKMRKVGIVDGVDPFTAPNSLRYDISARGVNVVQNVNGQLTPIECVQMSSWKDTLNYVQGDIPDRQTQYRGHWIIVSVWPDKTLIKDCEKEVDAEALRGSGNVKLVEDGYWFSLVRGTKETKIFTFDAPALAEVHRHVVNMIVVPGPLAALAGTDFLPSLKQASTIAFVDGENIYYVYTNKGEIESIRCDNLQNELVDNRIIMSMRTVFQNGTTEVGLRRENIIVFAMVGNVTPALAATLKSEASKSMSSTTDQFKFSLANASSLEKEKALPSDWKSKTGAMLYPLALFANNARFV